MGMPGMGAADIAAYAKPKAEASNVEAKTIVPKYTMTVAELRNFVNPMTKYYDNLPAKTFIEDVSISTYEKLHAIFGKTIDEFSTDKIKSMLDMMRKVVG